MLTLPSLPPARCAFEQLSAQLSSLVPFHIGTGNTYESAEALFAESLPAMAAHRNGGWRIASSIQDRRCSIAAKCQIPPETLLGLLPNWKRAQAIVAPTAAEIDLLA